MKKAHCEEQAFHPLYQNSILQKPGSILNTASTAAASYLCIKLLSIFPPLIQPENRQKLKHRAFACINVWSYRGKKRGWWIITKLSEILHWLEEMYNPSTDTIGDRLISSINQKNNSQLELAQFHFSSTYYRCNSQVDRLKWY